MKRRVLIAKALSHEPEILFLDEPTLGLDPQTRNNMWEHVKKVTRKEGMTVLFTTHYMEEAERVADRIAIIDHGKIIMTGTAAHLKEKTKTSSLEDAFLKLTGHHIRDESGSKMDKMRAMRRVWGR